MAPVKKGITDEDVQDYFDSASQQEPDFAVDGRADCDPQRALAGPDSAAQLTYRLPAGTYVLLCFVPDAETGEPHAAMGMHEVVTLK
jgi:hypothetical protein